MKEFKFNYDKGYEQGRKELINEIKLDLTMKINKYGLDFCYQKFLEHLDKLSSKQKVE
jgi:hypothetical protein